MATAYAYYGFSKRHNSTLIPAVAGTPIDLYLKGGCDILAPTFTLNASGIPSIDYILFEGRYYFVTGIRNVRDQLYEVSCQVDVLATYKADIQATSAYVLYYTHTNSEIVDHRLSTKTAITIDSSTQSFNNLGSGQSYLITAVGAEGTSIFACDKSDVDDIFTHPLLTQVQQDFEDEVDDIQQDLLAVVAGDVMTALKGVAAVLMRAFVLVSKFSNTIQFANDAMKYLKNCYVLPLDKSNIGGSSARIKLGAWNSNTYGNMGFPRIVHDSATVSIPWQSSDWRRNAPYHEIYLYIPYIGLVTIPASEVIGVTNLTINVSIDTYSGVTSFVVNADNGTVFGQYSTNIAASYAVGSSNIDVVNSGAQIVTSALAAMGNGLVGNAPGVIGGALGITNAIKPFDMSISANGGAAGMGLGNTVKCFTVFHDTTVTPGSISAVKGTPYNGVLSLSGISGYIQTMDASVAGSMTDTEREEINNLLNGGIYLE